MLIYSLAPLMGLFLFGLIIGSFLNVVIYRLPLQMRRAWGETNLPEMNIAWPASHCPSCQTPLRWWHNLPLISWLALKGRCGFCAADIPLRYPLVELSAGLLAVLLVAQLGWGWTSFAWVAWSWVLLTLLMIDWQEYLLPDVLTLPLLWAGLILHWLTGSDLQFDQAFLGAILGYLSLWSLYWLFKLLTGREGMGFGDFKLLAALGAWLGAPALLPIIMLSALSGLLLALLIKLKKQWQNQPLAFGPHLILAALAVKLGGWPLMEALQLGDWLRLTGWAF